jgi:hypothetical protein
MLERFIVKAGDTDATSAALKQQYYDLRTRAFAARWGDDYDKKPDTTYILYKEGDQMVVGMRILFHPPGSDDKLRTEVQHPDFDMHKLLPHMDIKNLSYCELSALAVDPQYQYSGRHLGTDSLVDMLNLFKAGTFKNGDHKVDVMMLSASKTGLKPMLTAAMQTQTPGIVRTDKMIQEEDRRFDTKLWPMVLSTDPAFPFLPDDLKGKVGESPAEFLSNYRE